MGSPREPSWFAASVELSFALGGAIVLLLLVAWLAVVLYQWLA